MRFSEILPSRWLQRLIIIVSLCLLVGIGVYFFIEQRQERQEKKRAGVEVSYVDLNNQNLDQRDNDNDGLANWEEVLWGLNPEKPDTDNDGVSDSEYVRNKKNVQLRSDLGIINTRLSESEELGRSLYTALLAIEQTGGVLDAETGEQISDNIVEYIRSIRVGEKLYFREDLNLVDDTKQNTYKYRDEMQSLLTQYPVEPQDIELIVTAIENSEPYKIRIARLSDRYATMIKQLATMEVPFLIAGKHTEFLNSMNHIAGTFQGLNQTEEDEIMLLGAVVQMEQVLTQASESLSYIQAFFDIISDESVFN